MKISPASTILLALLFTLLAAPQAPADEAAEAPAEEAVADQGVGTSLMATEADPLAGIAEQIAAFEHERAKVVLNAHIREIESASHRYDSELIHPLTLLGDAFMQSAKHEAALDAYNRAVHIDRVANGLHSPSQIDVIYREAAAWTALGNLPEANNRHEYAYEVELRRHSPTSMDLLEPTYRLADWYLKHYSLLPARALYLKAVNILEANGYAEHPDAIKPLRAIADTYRQQRFPPIYVTSTESEQPAFGYSETPRGSGLQTETNAITTVSQFPRGERALAQVVRILQADPNGDPVMLAEAMVELADWNLMFDYPRRAEPLYRRAYELYGEAGEDPEARFGQPEMLYYPRPANPRLPADLTEDDRTEGRVALSFTISQDGEVRRMDTILAEPDDRMVYRVRRSMRVARFRPSLVGGEMMASSDQRFTHTYPYYVVARAGADAGSAAAEGAAEVDPTAGEEAGAAVEDDTAEPLQVIEPVEDGV